MLCLAVWLGCIIIMLSILHHFRLVPCFVARADPNETATEVRADFRFNLGCSAENCHLLCAPTVGSAPLPVQATYDGSGRSLEAPLCKACGQYWRDHNGQLLPPPAVLEARRARRASRGGMKPSAAAGSSRGKKRPRKTPSSTPGVAPDASVDRGKQQQQQPPAAAGKRGKEDRAAEGGEEERGCSLCHEKPSDHSWRGGSRTLLRYPHRCARKSDTGTAVRRPACSISSQSGRMHLCRLISTMTAAV